MGRTAGSGTKGRGGGGGGRAVAGSTRHTSSSGRGGGSSSRSGGGGGSSSNRRAKTATASETSRVGGAMEHIDSIKVSDLEFPHGLPHPREERIISVICGNTNLHWAVHEGLDGQFFPVLFWRTSPVSDQDLRSNDSILHMQKYLPTSALEVVFGPGHEKRKLSSADSIVAAVQWRSASRIPALSVYMISMNEANERGVKYLFRDIASNIYRVKSSHFFPPPDKVSPKTLAGNLPYEGMGVDRVAALCGAVHEVGFPVLVWDAGTALTYSVVDQKGHVVGGGITLGIGSRLSRLETATDQLPTITVKELGAVVKECTDKSTRLATWGTESTKQNIIAAVVKELQSFLIGVTKDFADQFQKAKSDEAGATATGTSTPATVVVTGGDVDVLLHLLRAPGSSPLSRNATGDNTNGTEDGDNDDHNNKPEDVFPSIVPGVNVKRGKHLSHNAISYALLDHAQKESKLDAAEKLRQELIGQRVAKNFREDDGTVTLYRGSIVSVARGIEKQSAGVDGDLFRIFYDDSDGEELDVVEIYRAIQLYIDNGENPDTKQSNEMKEKMMMKKNEAQKALALLAEESIAVKLWIDGQGKDENDPPEIVVESVEPMVVDEDKQVVEAETVEVLPNDTAAPEPPAKEAKPAEAEKTVSANDDLADEEEEKQPVGRKRSRPSKAATSNSVAKKAKASSKEATETAEVVNAEEEKEEEQEEEDKGEKGDVEYDPGEEEGAKGTKVTTPRRRKQEAVPKSTNTRKSSRVTSTPAAKSPEVTTRASSNNNKASATKSPGRKKSSSLSGHDPNQYVGQRVAKYFEQDLYFGVVEAVVSKENEEDEELWHIRYDDNDEEDMDFKDLNSALKVYEDNKEKDKKKDKKKKGGRGSGKA